MITNTTYAALDMQTGTPDVSKKFGGSEGTDPDYFLLKIKGIGSTGEEVWLSSPWRITALRIQRVITSWINGRVLIFQVW